LTISYEDQILSNDKIFVKDSLRPDARVDIRQGIGWHVKGASTKKPTKEFWITESSAKESTYLKFASGEIARVVTGY
jgi:hypothetical protein